MNSTSTYTLQIRGQVNVNELNPMSPHHMTILESPASDTLFSIQTDQSGMIGTLTHLHNLGLTIVAVLRSIETVQSEKFSLENYEHQKES